MKTDMRTPGKAVVGSGGLAVGTKRGRVARGGGRATVVADAGCSAARAPPASFTTYQAAMHFQAACGVRRASGGQGGRISVGSDGAAAHGKRRQLRRRCRCEDVADAGAGGKRPARVVGL